MTGEKAAQIAEEAANQASGSVWRALTMLMCWDAVAACQNRAPGRYVETTDQVIATQGALRGIPRGATIGFFKPEGDVLVHAMLSLGGGLAAGNKNACIGMGAPLGWEILDLNKGWKGGAFGPRKLKLRARAFA